jgi:hypothetical protein
MRPESSDEPRPQVELPLMLHGVLDCHAAVRDEGLLEVAGDVIETGWTFLLRASTNPQSPYSEPRTSNNKAGVLWS